MIEIIGLIVHEATHIWQEVPAVMGEKEPSVEFEAYSVHAITQELLAAFDRTRGAKMLIVEDGSGMTNADAFIAVAYADEYHTRLWVTRHGPAKR